MFFIKRYVESFSIFIPMLKISCGISFGDGSHNLTMQNTCNNETCKLSNKFRHVCVVAREKKIF